MHQAYYTQWDEGLRGTVGGAISTGMVPCSRFCVLLTVIQVNLRRGTRLRRIFPEPRWGQGQRFIIGAQETRTSLPS